MDGGKPWPGREAAAVAHENLAAYLRGFRKLLVDHGLTGVLCGHFGAGRVHVRVDFDLATADGRSSGRRPRRPAVCRHRARCSAARSTRRRPPPSTTPGRARPYPIGLPPGHIGHSGPRRTLPGILPQLLPTVVALVGGTVAVEKIFNVPGLGRLAPEAVAQDLPLPQTAILALVLPGVAAGRAIRTLRHALLGRPPRDGGLPALHRPPLTMPRSLRRVTAPVHCSCSPW